MLAAIHNRLMGSAFVILLHSGNGPAHCDFLLEGPAAAETWQFLDDPATLMPSPASEAGEKRARPQAPEKILEIPAKKIQDHRLMYLDYEGPLSGGRGSVRQLDKGTYEMIARSANSLEFRLAGRVMKGTFLLQHAQGQWILRRLSQRR